MWFETYCYGPILFNHTDTYIGRSLELYGEFRKSESAMLCQRIREGGVVIDAGATVGTHTMFFSVEVGDEGAYSHLSHSGWCCRHCAPTRTQRPGQRYVHAAASAARRCADARALQAAIKGAPSIEVPRVPGS
jgi:hypothetical protein